jgi:hypothetical protein
MTARSVLRVRTVEHIHPDRKNETIIEVWRDGAVVATIYGSREGLHIVSERFDNRRNLPFRFQAENAPPSFVVPLLKENETCPWCSGVKEFLGNSCPVCTQ